MNDDVGFAYPFRFASGRVVRSGGPVVSPTNDDRDAAVRTGVMQVLQTEKFERVMFCDLGAGLSRWLFDPISGVASLIPIEVRRAVSDWCPRAFVSDVRVNMDPSAGQVVVMLVVRHNDSDSESLVRVSARSS